MPGRRLAGDIGPENRDRRPGRSVHAHTRCAGHREERLTAESESPMYWNASFEGSYGRSVTPYHGDSERDVFERRTLKEECLWTYSVEGKRVKVDTVVLPAYGIDPDDSVRRFLGLCTRLSEWDGVGAGGDIDSVERFVVHRDADGDEGRGRMRTEVQS